MSLGAVPSAATQHLDAAKFRIFDAEANLVRADCCKPRNAVAIKQCALNEMREAVDALHKAQRALEDEIFTKLETRTGAYAEAG